MSESITIAIYDSKAKAEDALSALERGGFPTERITIVTQNQKVKKKVRSQTDKFANGTILGATAGVIVGWLVGILANAAFVWVPGVGFMLVTGHIGIALLGGIEGVVAGSAAGGILGTLLDCGISELQVFEYKKKLKEGKYLVIVRGSTGDLVLAQNILAKTDADELHIHAQTFE